MNYKYKIILTTLSFLTSLILKAEYNIVNAFPNLTFEDPIGIYHAGDNTNRIFVLEQEGRIKVFNNDPVLPPNGYAGRSWNFYPKVHIQDNIGSRSKSGNIFLFFLPKKTIGAEGVRHLN